MSQVVAALERVARSHPAEIAIEQAGATVRYDALIASVHALGERLRRDGLACGDSVTVQGGAVASLVQAALAVRASGGVPCLAPSISSAFRARFALTVAASEATLRALDAPAQALPEGTAWVRVTGGTTGAARAVAFNEGQALAAARRSAEMLGLEAGDTLVSSAPPVTAYGWNAGVLGPLLAGARVLHREAWDLRGILTSARDGVAWIVATPPVVRALGRLDSDARPRTRSRLLTATSSYPDEAAQICAERHGLAIIDRYGAAECGPVAQADEPGGALRPATGASVRVFGDGRLEIASDAVGIGYVGEGAAFGGRFATADCAELLGDGRFRILARADRIDDARATPWTSRASSVCS